MHGRFGSDAVKQRIPLWRVVAVLLALSSFSAHAEKTTRLTAREIRQARSISGPVQLRGIVTGFSGWRNSFFLQDSTGAISIDRQESTPVSPGDEVEISGHARPGLFAPVVLSDSTRVITHPGLPAAATPTYDNLIDGTHDSRLVRITGVVHGVRSEQIWGRKVVLLDLEAPGGPVVVHILDPASGPFDNLVDSTVRITGVCGTIFSDRRQILGLRLFAADFKSISIVRPSPALEAIPVTPIRALGTFGGPALDHRIHVTAGVTYRAKNGDIFLQDGESAIRARGSSLPNVEPGAHVDAWGFVENSGFTLRLERAIVRVSGQPLPLLSVRMSASDAIRIESGFSQAPFDGLLINTEGEITGRLPHAAKLVWEIRDQNVKFQAELPDLELRYNIALDTGTRVRLTGICVAEMDDSGQFRSFRILLRSPQDIVVISSHYRSASFFLLAALFGFVIAGSILVRILHQRHIFEQQFANATVLRNRFETASHFIALALVALGSLALLAWMFPPNNAETLRGWHSAIKPNTAFALLCSGAGVYFYRVTKRTQSAIAMWTSGLVLLFLGIGTIVEDLLHRDLHLDSFLLLPTAVPFEQGEGTRVALATAFCLVILGCSACLSTIARLNGVSQVLAISSSVLTTLNIVGEIYGRHVQYGPGAQATMPLLSAVGLFLLSLAIVFKDPDGGVMRTVCSGGPGGAMVRRMMPFAVLCPILLGWIRLQGQIQGYYDMRFGLTLFALLNVVAFGLLIWGSGAILNRLDDSRAATERDLHTREHKLEMIFATGAIGDFNWKVGSDVVTAHRSIWEMYGETETRGSGPAHFFRERQHPDDAATIETGMTTAIERRQPFDFEFRVVWPDGTVRWIECRGTPEFDGDDFVQVNGLNIDITEKKLAQERLKQSELLFRELADAMPQIVWTSGPDGINDYYNRRWLDYTQDTEHWERIVHPDDIEIARVLWAQCVEERCPYQQELRLKRMSDGVYRWHLARAVPVLDQNGRVKRWFGTSTDIDDFQRASAELQALNELLEERVNERSLQLLENERRHRELLESISDYAIFMLDSHGRVAIWNASAERITGYSSAEILGRHYRTFHRHEDIERRRPEAQLREADEQGASREEGWRVRRDGSVFWANVIVNAIRDRNGNVVGYSKVMRDMTDQKRAEELLIAEQQRAEQANKAKSSFLATMSHEIRTPLNAIVGMADLLWDTDLDLLQREYVGRFRRAGSNLATLINDILDMSKIESGRFELECVPFDLPDLLDRTTELLEPRATLKGLRLQVRVGIGTPRQLLGDPSRLQQILFNLVGNAIKFTESGSVSLRVCADMPGERGRLQFTVEDTGIGIPASQIDAVFEDFTQAESSTTRRFGGTGLGLAICRRLVERMGGSLSVESRQGVGSTFTFDARFGVPVALATLHNGVPDRGEIPVHFVSDGEPRPLAPVNILAAEDSEDNRFLLSAYLKSSRYRISFAENGREAVEMAQLRSWDLILMDIQMPEMDGLTATFAIREHERVHELAPTPIVALTANALVEDVESCKAAGCNSHLSKPISKDRLIASIESLRGYSDPVSEPRPQGSGVLVSRGSVRVSYAPIEVLDELRELSRDYIGARQSEISGLRDHLLAGDLEALRIAGHNMKGTAASLGFCELTTLGEAIESAARKRNREGLHDALEEMERYVAYACSVTLDESAG